MFNQIIYQGSNSGAGLSPGLWQNCPDRVFFDRNAGFFYMDDFLNLGATTAPYQYVGDASPAFAQADEDDAYGGLARAAITNTDNNEAYIGSGNDAGTMFALDTRANGGKPFWFECRVRSSYITDWGFICGLGGATIVAANLVADNQTSIANSASFIGYRILTADADGLDAVYLTAAGSENVAKEVAGTIVVDTFIKLGMYFHPVNGLEYFVNGVSQNPGSARIAASAAGVPDGEGLEFVCGAKTGTTAAINLDIDWWAVGMQLDWE